METGKDAYKAAHSIDLQCAAEASVLRELSAKIDQFSATLLRCEERSQTLLSEAQNCFADSFNIDCLVSLLQVLETKFATPEFLRIRDRGFVGYLYRLDCKMKQQMLAQSLDSGAAEKYVKVSRQIYRVLHKLCVSNKKASSIMLTFSKQLSGQIYQFNKEIRKLLGTAIPCAMPFPQSNVDPVVEWFKLLSPMVKTSYNNNIVDQLVALRVIRGLCQGHEGKGNIVNQRTFFKLMQETNDIVLGFGVDENRPYVSFSQNDKTDQDFLNNNPTIAAYSRVVETAKDKVLCVYLDDLSKNKRATQDYIAYLTQVLRLFSAMCVGRFNAGIAELGKRGLAGYHIVTCLKMSHRRLHPKLVQAYLELARTLCIDVDPLTSVLVAPNRCFLYISLLFSNLPR